MHSGCSRDFQDLGRFRQHFTKSHPQSSYAIEPEPYLHQNQPSRREINNLLGNPVVDVLNQAVNENVTTASESPQTAPQHPYANNGLTQPGRSTDIDVPVSTISFEHPEDPDLSKGGFEGTQSLPDEKRLPWFDRSKYNKVVDADGVTRYIHRTAGRSLGKAKTAWQKLLEERSMKYPNPPWYPFANENEWRLGYWLATSKSSQSKIDEFLDMDGILAEQPTFGRAYNLFNKLEKELNGFGDPPWHCQEIPPESSPEATDEELFLYLRDVEECLDCFAGRPDLEGQICFAPEIRFAGDDEIQIFDEMTTGQLWHQILNRVHMEGDCADAALGGALFGSDRTNLTHYAGDVKVHALYVSLGNISKDTRAQTSKRAWMLLAYIPICKWENTLERLGPVSKSEKAALPGILSRRLFHLCMEIICEPLMQIHVHKIVDPGGDIRLIFYVLLAYLADLEEQYMIAALDKSNCIHCTATTSEFGLPEPQEPRTQQSILEAIERVRREQYPNAPPYKFSLGAGKEGLGDVEYPFWTNPPWSIYAKLYARMKAQVLYSGGRVFAKGVCHISQMSCKEHRALLKVHLSVMANADIMYSREVTLATRALVDYMYYAQLPTHTDLTLEAYIKAYQDFHRYMHVCIKNESRRGEKGPIDHFNIPKIHAAHHMAEQIRLKGTADNFSTETIEHLHIDTIKHAYPATNKKEWQKQTIRWLIRREKITEVRLFQIWRKGLLLAVEPAAMPMNMGDSGSTSPDMHVRDQEETVTAIDTGVGDGMPRFKRGGFAPTATNDVQAETDALASLANPVMARAKKRKRQIDDVDDKEDRAAKRVERVQQTYSLSQYQDIALRPPESMTIAAIQEKYGLPTLLEDCKASNLLPSSFNQETVVGVWSSIRLSEPPRRLFPRVEWARVNAEPPSGKDPAVADPVLYPRDSNQVNSAKIRLHDCDAGRLRLIFGLISPSTRVQPQTANRLPTRLFAYLHKFKPLATSTLENATNMLVVKKPARIRPCLVKISQLV
ncbi:beige protein [Ceratobasidium sp. AG-Ba]|nr:beige protein [Ceratobasidium sp. AG-Ba]